MIPAWANQPDLSKPGGQNYCSSSRSCLSASPPGTRKDALPVSLPTGLHPSCRRGSNFKHPGRLRALEANVHAGEGPLVRTKNLGYESQRSRNSYDWGIGGGVGCEGGDNCCVHDPGGSQMSYRLRQEGNTRPSEAQPTHRQQCMRRAASKLTGKRGSTTENNWVRLIRCFFLFRFFCESTLIRLES